jgi:exopolyphosphatase/guanosine-5'-triphosphate,3'-diphosphate pyrophosphatase
MIQSRSFPIQAAAIDIGSNALRLSIAEFNTPTEFRILDADRYPLRLGHDVFVTGKLAPQTLDSALQGLGGFMKKIRAAQIGMFKAVATSAIRESRNGAELVGRAQSELELPIEVITGSEEARLVHLAVRSRMELGMQRWLLVDLGGGSVEVSLVDETGILWSESHTMGSIRLLEELTDSEHEPGRFARLLTEYISTLSMPAAALSLKPAGFIATGGNIESLAKLAVAEDSGNGVSTIPLEALKSSIATLSRLSYQQRISELGLREDRADVILPAAVVYQRLAELAGAESIVVPHVGIREGVLIDLM